MSRTLFSLICGAVRLNDTVRVHDAELNSSEQIFHPLIHVMLGCFAIDRGSSVRLHAESGPSSSSASLCRLRFGGREKIRSVNYANRGGTPRNRTSIAKLDQVASAN